MLWGLSSGERQMLQNAYSIATEASTSIRDHMLACNDRADRAERETRDHRAAISALIEAIAAKVDGTRGQIDGVRRWVVALVLSGLGTALMTCLLIIGWLIEHYVLKGSAL